MEGKTLESLLKKSSVEPDLLTIEATVASGLESVAEGECHEIFGEATETSVERGRVYFNIHRNVLREVFHMRSIDNVYIIVYEKKCDFQFDKEEDMLILFKCYFEIDWKKPISIWQEVYKYTGNVYPTKEEYNCSKRIYDAINLSNPKKCKIMREKMKASASESEDDVEKTAGVVKEVEKTQENFSQDSNDVGEKENVDTKKEPEVLTGDENSPAESKITIPKFRVSSKRVGVHAFSSEDVAKTYGSLIQEAFFWIVDLTEFDMEIVANITDFDFIVSISLTKSSLHRRNLTAFGLTSLRATICYGLLKLALPKPGDIVIDPLAGSGSIPIEGAAAFSKSFVLAGDLQEAACGLIKKNVDNFDCRKKLPLDVLKWDTANLPLRTSSIDVIVTDMPFGKRSGSKASNKVLYPNALKEFGRILRNGSGRAVLLTADRRSLELAYNQTKQLWNVAERRLVNVGGIKALVFILRRAL
ncbi:THUMP domain-containing protein 3-like isoform X1 [Ischnura elegans]|nr:THUMP domain-containing protein 3-like isoform X1 [Ischnura elegans]XP_046406101.1 THUMP domain-containing protein 3-like isoform X1 [Ischnura elegans]XP_046406102.1 THUMP domain-containing protein 3-like isoform X1 [Ischnura elegans]